MVHALRETHRALKPNGILLDLRPQAAEAPLEVTHNSDAKMVCRFDGSPGKPADVASDRAVDLLVDEGLFEAVEEQNFLFHDYWDNVDELHAYATENWNRFVIPNLDDFQEARRKMAAADPSAKLRTTKRLRLIAYRSC